MASVMLLIGAVLGLAASTVLLASQLAGHMVAQQAGLAAGLLAAELDAGDIAEADDGAVALADDELAELLLVAEVGVGHEVAGFDPVEPQAPGDRQALGGLPGILHVDGVVAGLEIRPDPLDRVGAEDVPARHFALRSRVNH